MYIHAGESNEHHRRWPQARNNQDHLDTLLQHFGSQSKANTTTKTKTTTTTASSSSTTTKETGQNKGNKTKHKGKNNAKQTKQWNKQTEKKETKEQNKLFCSCPSFCSRLISAELNFSFFFFLRQLSSNRRSFLSKTFYLVQQHAG